MANFLKNTALALSAAGMVAASVPAVAAVPMHNASVQVNAGYGDREDEDDQGGRWEHHRHDRGRHNGWNRGGVYDQRYNQGAPQKLLIRTLTFQLPGGLSSSG